MGSPLSILCREFSREAWLRYKGIPYLQRESINVLRGQAQEINATKRTATYLDSSNTIRTISYDVLVLANGLQRPWPVVPDALTKAEYLDGGDRYALRLAAAERVAVVGGGKLVDKLRNIAWIRVRLTCMKEPSEWRWLHL